MSIKLMAAAWDANVPSTEKMVLLCLCDFANDAGVCWPSVKTIAAKCSVSERTVQGAIKRLRETGFCSWDDTPGKPHQFRLDPRKICTPAEPAPPQELQKPPQNLRHTPAESAPKPSITTKEPPKSNNRACVEKPEGVTDQTWQDFERHRHRLGADVTVTALSRIASQAEEAGWSLEDALAECVARGWRGFKAEWVRESRNDRQHPHSTKPTTRQIGERIAAGFAAGGNGDSHLLPSPRAACGHDR